MKFDVEIEDYGNAKNNASYKNVEVTCNGEDMNIVVDGKYKKYEYVDLYAITTERIIFTCMIQDYNGFSKYTAGEITLRYPGGNNEE